MFEESKRRTDPKIGRCAKQGCSSTAFLAMKCHLANHSKESSFTIQLAKVLIHSAFVGRNEERRDDDDIEVESSPPRAHLGIDCVVGIIGMRGDVRRTEDLGCSAFLLLLLLLLPRREIVICGMGLRLRPRCDSVFTSFADRQAGRQASCSAFVKTRRRILHP